MANIKSIRRYSLLLRKLNGPNKPSAADLLDFLEQNDIKAAKRTLERDFQFMRDTFHIEVCFDRNAKGYYIDSETSLNPELLFNFMDLANTAELFNPANKSKQHYLYFQKQNLQKGTHYLSPILNAIDIKLKLEISYQPFYVDAPRAYIIHPYLLKEFDQRWYVYAFDQDGGLFKSFALDRILECKASNESYKLQKIDRDLIFNHLIGISGEKDHPEKVVLRFTSNQAKYITSLPIHHSQKEIAKNDESVTFEYWLVPNYELKQEILKHGEQVEVLEPAALIDEIVDRLQKSLNQYR